MLQFTHEVSMYILSPGLDARLDIDLMRSWRRLLSSEQYSQGSMDDGFVEIFSQRISADL